jgi:hypothetical protein
LVQEKDQVMVVALALKIVASQGWKVDCLMVLPHLHLMMCRGREIDDDALEEVAEQGSKLGLLMILMMLETQGT